MEKLQYDDAITSSRQFFEQCLSLFQIGGIEPLGKPAIDGGEEVASFGPPASLAPQQGQARGGPQLIGLCLLPSRYAQRLFEGVLALFNPVETEQRDAFEAMKLWLPPALPRFLLFKTLLSEVVEKYRRCTAVPIWMVGLGSVARRLGSWRSLGALRPSVGLPLAVTEPSARW